MKKILIAAAAALPMLAGTARAWNPVGPVKVDAGADWHFDVTMGQNGCCPKAPAQPWYTYWPYQAYFQVPAPVGGYAYPFWPAPATAARDNAPARPAAPTTCPQTQLRPAPQTGIQPAGYSAEVPGYWYGR